MKTEEDTILEQIVQAAHEDFNREINNEESAEYRRGFKAGRLFSAIHIKDRLRTLRQSKAAE